MVKIFIKFEIQKIRKEFREFYGHLPIEELVENMKLIQKIQKLEEQLRGLLDDEQTA